MQIRRHILPLTCALQFAALVGIVTHVLVQNNQPTHGLINVYEYVPADEEIPYSTDSTRLIGYTELVNGKAVARTYIPRSCINANCVLSNRVVAE